MSDENVMNVRYIRISQVAPVKPVGQLQVFFAVHFPLFLQLGVHVTKMEEQRMAFIFHTVSYKIKLELKQNTCYPLGALETSAWWQNERKNYLYNLTEPDFSIFL
jgi:hypothetical protein